MISYRMGKKEWESAAEGGKVYSQESRQRDKGNFEREVKEEKSMFKIIQEEDVVLKV